MKLLLRGILALLLVLVLASIAGLVVAVFFVLQDQPALENPAEISVEDVRRVRAFIRRSDPRNLQPGDISAFTVNDTELELLTNYGLSQLRGGAADITLGDNQATVEVSARVLDNPLGDYLNVSVGLSRWSDRLVVDNLRIGSLTVPGRIADFVARNAHGQLQRFPEYAAAVDAINGFSISPGQLNVVYQWQPELADQLSERGRNLLIPADEQERLLAHATRLANVTRSGELNGVTSAAALLAPMFEFAATQGGDPIEQNRAALLVTGMYILGISVPKALGLPASSVPTPGRHRLTLSGRHDFAQHFLVSAALTAGAGSSLADTIGLLKELDDSQGGSGFSFTDIGADRTGVRFAELALTDSATARAVQSLLGQQPTEDLFMADFLDLPESMPEAEFIGRFGGVGEPAYRTVLTDIENRIAATRLFRELDR